MNTAKNITLIADESASQAIQMCESQSISVVCDGEANEYLFPDGSCVRVENRQVTEIQTLSA